MFLQDRMTANGNSPLDSMRTLEHYLSDIMRAGTADTPEHVKGKIILVFLVLVNFSGSKTCYLRDIASFSHS